MVKMIYTLGVSALALSGTILALAVLDWSRQDPRAGEFLARPSAIQRFGAQNSGSGVRSAEISPLIAQAEAYARGELKVSGTNGMKISNAPVGNNGFSEQKRLFSYAPVP